MRRLLVTLTAGTDDPERCAQAWTVSATAIAAGAEVEMWLTGDATLLAAPGAAEAFVLPHSAPLADLRDAVMAGGSLIVCTQCAARRGLTEADLLPGVRIKGSASFVEVALSDDVQALVY